MQRFQIITRGISPGSQASGGRVPAQGRAAAALALTVVLCLIDSAPVAAPLDVGHRARTQRLADLSPALAELAIDPAARALDAAEAAARFGPASRDVRPVKAMSTLAIVAAALAQLEGAASAPPSHATLASAISEASRATGISSRYLWRTAQRESAFDPHARAARSSARGLFQFIDDTWLTTFSRHGAAWGYGSLAQAIAKGQGASGDLDPTLRRRVLLLRYDPVASTRMAASLAAQNRADLQRRLGRLISDDELYLSHLLGAAGAARLLAAAASPAAPSAASLLPMAAAANPSVFYTGGRAMSARDVLERIKHG